MEKFSDVLLPDCGLKDPGAQVLKVGHGGTLDTLATGVMVIGLGDGCSLLKYYLHSDKASIAAQTGMRCFFPLLDFSSVGIQGAFHEIGKGSVFRDQEVYSFISLYCGKLLPSYHLHLEPNARDQTF